jgi:hypothetical protein
VDFPRHGGMIAVSEEMTMARRPRRNHEPHIQGEGARENAIERRRTKVRRPWSNGQIDRTRRTIIDAAMKRFHYDDHAQLRRRLAAFIDACNNARRRSAISGLGPYESICKCFTIAPSRFEIDPRHHMPGLNT